MLANLLHRLRARTPSLPLRQRDRKLAGAGGAAAQSAAMRRRANAVRAWAIMPERGARSHLAVDTLHAGEKRRAVNAANSMSYLVLYIEVTHFVTESLKERIQ